ncbi:MAG TPA: hypothetical protein VKS81_01820 [Bacteroidota bacterium]|nr:hypothetical protein [Bacteroidota bacterium]
MGEPLTDSHVETSKQSQSLEQALGRLWEKIRSASELINALRTDNRNLNERVDILEAELTTLRSEVVGRDVEIKRLRAERSQILQSNGEHHFSQEEKDSLKEKIRDLIAKINSHLQ